MNLNKENNEKVISSICQIKDCGRSIHKESKYCIFHARAEEKTEDDFKRKLKEYVDKIAEEDGNYDFKQFIFVGGIDFKKDLNITVFKNVDFGGAVFKGRTDFGGAVFEGGADFGMVAFKERAYFGDAVFKGDAYFWRADFNARAYFRDADFKGDADFRESDFKGGADFLRAFFKGHTDFGMAAFKEGGADFLRAFFKGPTDFGMAAFREGDADFREVAFEGRADFGMVAFKGGADFWKADFKGDADFRESDFKGRADFRDAVFKERAHFGDATFKERAYFGEAVFRGEAYFWGVAFEGGAEFGEVAFEGDVDFRLKYFLKILNFSKIKTLSGKKLSIQVINGKGEISFERAYLENIYLNIELFEGVLIDFTDVLLRNTKIEKDKIENHIFQEKEKIFSEAKEIYLLIKNNFHSIGKYEDESWAFKKEKDMERKSLSFPYYNKTLKEENRKEENKKKLPFLKWIKKGKFLKWMVSGFSNMIYGYGEKPWNVVIVAGAIIIVFAYFFSLIGIGNPEIIKLQGIIHPIPGTDMRLVSEGVLKNTKIMQFSNCLYFSLITFTTLGYGDFRPLEGLGRILAGSEAFLGAIMMALFVYTFARKTGGR